MPMDEAAQLQEKMLAMNEALLLGSLRQHELTEAAEKLNEQLRASEGLFSGLVEHAPFGMYVVDAQFRVQQVNRRAMPIFSNVHPLVGRDFSEVIEVVWGAEVGGQIIGIFRHTLETGERYLSPPFTEQRHDIGVEQSYEWELQRVILPDGQHAVVCYFADISGRKQAEEARARLAAIVEFSSDAILSKDLNGIITSWNAGAGRLFGYTAQEAIGQSVTLLIPAERRDEESGFLKRIRDGERIEHYETVRRRKDGTLLDVSLTVSPIVDSQGDVVGASKIARDITGRRALEDSLAARALELARADRSKDEFLAMLAHELRNPLAPLRNAVEILQTSDATADERGEAQDIVARQIENMTRMIDDLLDVSRITEGKIELLPQPVALADILTAAVNVARPGITARSQELAITLPAEPIFLNADTTRLEQVFGNLLTNACKYSDPGRHIALSAERSVGVEPPEVIVHVRDDGMGIASDLLPHIFDLFVQSTRSLDRAYGGLGVGLTLVQRLVKMHGGSVEARSDGLGHGSEFIVRLPILSEPAAAPPPPPAPPARDIPRRILVVDDNEDSARSMSMIQRLRGHETRTAFTGPAAVAAAVEFVPEVVLLDIGLPGMDGFEVARRLRATPSLAGAFLVATTGYASDEDRSHALAAGFDKYLVKPVDLDLLREWLRSLVLPRADRD